jgi:PhoH-like ATPase
VSLIVLTGIAGTGKTLISIASALEQSDRYKSILVSRPAIELSNRTLGFLPGGIEEKIDPYMMPLYDNMGVIRDAQSEKLKKERKKKKVENNEEKPETIKKWMEGNKVEISALNYIRGRTLTNTFFIVDEAQNLTPQEIKTIVTRAGEGTKIVFTGDIRQIDNPYLDERSNGLSYLIGSKLREEPDFAHVELIEGERSPLAEKASLLL